MKKYNKPVVEINGFEVEDIMTTSGFFTEYENKEELQAVYLNLTGNSSVDLNDKIAVYEW